MDIRQFYTSFSPEALDRGKRIYESGGVTRLTRGLSGKFYGTVRDRHVEYRTIVTVSEDMTASELGCSCPSSGLCCHEAAFLTAILERADGGDFAGISSTRKKCVFSDHGYASVCPEYIASVSRGRETAAEARRIVSMDRVTVLSDDSSPGGRRVSARVGSHNRFSSAEEDTELTFDRRGLPLGGRCGCMPDGGVFMCQHMVALLLALFPEDTVPEIETSDAVKRLIAESASYRRISAAPGTVRLVPELSLSFDSRLCLGLLVGRERLFAVRSISEFLDAVKAGINVGYGKNFFFDHSIDSFDDAGKALIRFLRSRRGDELPVYGGSASGVFLGENNIDDFFSLLTGDTILFDSREVLLRRTAPEFKLLFSRAGRNGCRVSFDGEPLCLLGCGEQSYILCGDTLFIAGREFSLSVSRLLKNLCEAGGEGLLMSLGDLGRFFSRVIQPAREYISWRFEDETLLEMIPPELSCRVRISSDRPDWAKAEIIFSYGERTERPFERLKDPDTRDTALESRIERIVSDYLPHIDPESGTASITGDGAAVYRLVREGLERIGDFASVEAVGDLYRAGIRLQPDIRFSMNVSGGLLELNLDAGIYSPEELAEVLKALSRGETYFRFEDGTYADLEDSALAQTAELLRGLTLTPEELSGQMKLPMFRMLYLEAAAAENSRLTFEKTREFRRTLREFDSVSAEDSGIPEELLSRLRPYQAEGFLWMRSLESRGFGGILADDMGLGKTVQALALALSAPPAGTEGLPVMVVCPTSLVANWAAECRRFAPSLSATSISGTAAERAGLISKIGNCSLAITSYDSLKRDIPLYASIEFRAVIADEAQYIKNRLTQAANAVKALSARARFALTGTPVENSPSELWSIFDFLMPGYLGNYHRFRNETELPISEGDKSALARLRRQTSPFILRRVKRDVLKELPEKTESVLYTRLEGEQLKAYAAVASTLVQELREKLSHAGISPEERFDVLTMLLRLRQICCHPPLCLGDGYSGESAKLELCMELLLSLSEGGHRVLVFSQFTSMLDILAERISGEGLEYFMLTGKTPAAERLDLVRRFNEGERSVFLISLKAGGTGLNLTGADSVIHYDPWWNVAAQDQATDRAYRIGQDRHVHVWRLIAEDTVEQKILDLQEKKAELASALVDGSDGSALNLSPEELLALFEG